MADNRPLPRGAYRAANGVIITAEQIIAIRSGLSRGLTTNAIIGILRETPLKVQRQAAYQLTGDLLRNYRLGAALNKQAANYVPTAADYGQIAQRSDRRYRTTGLLDLTRLEIPGVTQVYGFHSSNAQLPLDTQRRSIFTQLSAVIQSLKDANPDTEIDVSEADIQFVSADSFLP